MLASRRPRHSGRLAPGLIRSRPFGQWAHRLDDTTQALATVTVVSAMASLDPQGIRQALAQIGAGHDQWERFSGQWFDELDALGAELLRRQKAWQSEQRLMESGLRQQAAQLEQQRAALAKERERLREEIERQRERVRREVEREVAEAAAANPPRDQRVERQAAELEQERALLEKARRAAESQAAVLSRAAGEQAEARHEVERQPAEHPGIHERAPPGQPPANEAVQQRLQELERERAAWAGERAVLENELEAVRSRAAEMAELLAQQRRQMEERQSQFADELKRVRRLLETLSRQHAEPPGEGDWGPAPARDSPPARPSPASPAADPVLEFEMLQKSLVRRKQNVQAS